MSLTLARQKVTDAARCSSDSLCLRPTQGRVKRNGYGPSVSLFRAGIASQPEIPMQGTKDRAAGSDAAPLQLGQKAFGPSARTSHESIEGVILVDVR